MSTSALSHSVANTSSDKENIEMTNNNIEMTNNIDNSDDNNIYAGEEEEEMALDVKTAREMAELSKMTDSGAAKMFLEELRKKSLEKSSLDPRSSSRMPSAAAEPPYRPRYDSPLFACESLYQRYYCYCYYYYFYF